MDNISNTVTISNTFGQPNISDENRELAEKLNDEMTQAVLPVTIFVGIEIFAAFFGNIFVIYVFFFRYHVCNFRYFVLCLAVTDLTSSLTTMPGEMVTQLYWYVYPLPVLCKVKSFFNVFTVSAEALCLLTIGVDRYLKVCRPLGHQMKPKHAIIVCGVIYVFAVILAIPVYILWGTHHKEMIYRNRTILVTVCEKDEKWLNTNHPLQYSIAIEVIISICLVVMFILYVFVVRVLLKNKQFRSNAYGLGRQNSPPNSSNPIEFSQETSEVGNSTRDNTTAQGNLEQENTIKDVTSKCRESKISAIIDDDHDNRPKNKNVLALIRQSEISDNGTNSTQPNRDAAHNTHNMLSRVRRKTLIMFILTVVFIITTILYLTLLSFIARSILDTLSNGGKAVYFFFFRLYFINHVINPIIYGVLDPHFKQVVSHIRSSVSATFGY